MCIHYFLIKGKKLFGRPNTLYRLIRGIRNTELLNYRGDF